jgi:hypothetical protein
MDMQKKIIIILCEGPSERAYIQELNRYLDEEDIPINFIPKVSGGGQFCLVIRKFKEIRKQNPKRNIKVWVDFDRYKRNDNKDMDNYRSKSKDIPDFLFSYMNFEDFIAMHENTERLNNWIISCIRRNHFISPSHSSEYLKEFIDFIGDYTKGEIPILINKNSLQNLKTHQEDNSIMIKCDLARDLFSLLDPYLKSS